MTREELASLLLMSPESLEAVEREENTLSEFRLNMIANTFHVSKSGLVNGKSVPLMSFDEIAGVLEKISKEIAELQQKQAVLEEQIYDKWVNNSLDERYTEAMKMAGYELVETDPDSMATVTFRIENSNEKIGFDGWELVGQYLEDVVLNDEADANSTEEETLQEEREMRM